MLFAAMKLRMHKDLKNPTLLVVVDRKDLDTQITGTFTAADVPNMKTAKSIKSLEDELKNDSRKIIITTIFRFKDVKETLNERENIIVLVDEAHRTQEGDLGILMRKALPNAFFFGLTGTPINKRERNTFATFGCEEDKDGYISKYSFEDSIRDDATKPLTFEPRLVNLHLDKEKMKKELDELTDSLSDLEKKELTKRAGGIATFIKSDERIKAVCGDIAYHYKNVVEPQKFKAMVVCYDRECCIKYKEHLDELLGKEASTIVMTVKKGEGQEYEQYDRGEDEEKRLIENHYKKVDDPLKILIVTAKLLTGFDAPIAQTMYLDKPLKEHTLLQAICRVNRVYKHKEFGLIVDYIGVFDEVSKALSFDSESMQKVIENIDGYVKEFPIILKKCLSYFECIDRDIDGYDGLIAAQNCLYNDEIRDQFGKFYSHLSKLWEAISPHEILENHIDDYRWLTDVYRSIRPSNNMGSLIWHRLGAKTMEIINRNIHAVNIYDDLDKIVLDPTLISEIMSINNPVEVKRIELDVTKRIRKNIEEGQLQFKELADKLEELKVKYESNFMHSVEFLKELIALAKEVIKREKESVNDEEELYAVKTGKAALTELFNDVKGEKPNIVVENLVNDIDNKIVNEVKLFIGWQESSKGQREVRIAILKVFAQYKLQGDKELVEKTYGYIAEYY
ncbi:type I restriction endonuclease subunit R [[Clostridium] dakarense]|uniref:type I restriction endonuclease subunit R n=1 Tax=Faecalimicrobium dakarense TaxID=1301100 RepID=UPI0004ADB6B5|nr:HsdR family type I site-specific deoxyribonuclease [[Clostridium] dakarense]